jgi:3-hydroxyacyl-CoA dehydrogenase
MSQRIKKAAVLGAGVMGSGIAAHLANAGIPVVMLDLQRFAYDAMGKLKKQRPAPLFTTAALSLIEPGNIDTDLKKISDCDWVVEVAPEKLDLKQQLFAKVDPLLKPGSIISSNTSGMSIKGMTQGRSAGFKKSFLVTHFFNPVRYMKLLEVVAGEETDPAVMQRFAEFGERMLGKGIVYGKDTTNFIANRIGTYGMMKTLAHMQADGFTVEEVDKIFGPPLGRPKSAVFRTADLVGLDTLMHVTQNCYDTLTQDEERDTFKPPDFLLKMVDKKMLGDKTGGGFYKKSTKGEGEKEILALDLKTLEYRSQNKVRYESLGAIREIESLPERVAAFTQQTDRAAKFAEVVSLETLAYASRRIPEIADDIVNVDRALRWGFAWDIGPFESWDAIGVKKGLERMKALGIKPAAWVDEMVSKGREKFYDGDTYWDIKKKAPAKIPSNPRNVSIEILKRGNKKIDGNESASLWDMGDGVALLEFHSKMNSIDDQITELMEKAADLTEKSYKGLVIGNDGANFSVGANIGALMMAVGGGEWEMVRAMVRRFQNVNQRLRYSQVPVVTAPFQMTLGGGAEVTMAGNAVQAAAETYMGLVEVGVGLIPGGGGNLMLMRNVFGAAAGSKDFDALPFLKKLFLSIGTAKVATSAEEAREAGFLSAQDGISMSRDALLADAKARCIGMADSGFMPPRPATFLLPGKSGAATIDMLLYDMQLNHQISEHDRLIGKKLATVLTGGDTTPSVPVTEQQLLDLELEAFLSLCGEEKTQARIMFMLEKGKPLRN